MNAARTQQEAPFFAQLGEPGATEALRDPVTAGAESVSQLPSAPALPQKKPRKPDRRRALTRNAIIEAAADLFIERGVEATTIDDIAAAAELSAGTLYFHFGNKESVVLALVNSVLESEAGYLAVPRASDSAIERLLDAGDRYFRFAVEQPVAFQFIVAGLPTLPEDASEDATTARRAVAARVREFAAAVASDLGQAMDDGEIDAIPVDEALALLWGTWNGVAGLIRRDDEFAISKTFGERILAGGRSVVLGALLGGRRSA